MSLLTILSLVIQVALIVHDIKTERNMLWIMALAFLPGIGALAYVIAEIIPELFGSRTARRARSGVHRMMDPDRDLRRASAEVEVSGNVDARRRLADELSERGQYAQAIETYQAGLKGIFEHDVTLLLGLARAQFANGDPGAARVTLERLRAENPEIKSLDADLLYARALESVGALEEAERAYAAVSPGYPGAEARLRYALVLKKRGKPDAARAELKDLLDGARLGPRHYQKAQAEWLERARRELG